MKICYDTAKAGWLFLGRMGWCSLFLGWCVDGSQEALNSACRNHLGDKDAHRGRFSETCWCWRNDEDEERPPLRRSCSWAQPRYRRTWDSVLLNPGAFRLLMWLELCAWFQTGKWQEMGSPHVDFEREAVTEPCGAATLHTVWRGEELGRSWADLTSQEPNQVDARLVLKREYCEDERLAWWL